jgi:hypothetical protein
MIILLCWGAVYLDLPVVGVCRSWCRSAVSLGLLDGVGLDLVPAAARAAAALPSVIDGPSLDFTRGGKRRDLAFSKRSGPTKPCSASRSR